MDRGLHILLSTDNNLDAHLIPPTDSPKRPAAPPQVTIPTSATTPAALRGYNFYTFGIIILALLIASTRMLSAFGSRSSEETAIADLLDKIPRSNLIEDYAASEGLAIFYCAIMGGMNALSEMFKVLDFFLSPKAPKEALAQAPADPLENATEGHNQHSTYIYSRSIFLSACNALITGCSTANGVLLFGGKTTNIGCYIAAISAGAIVFGSSTFFNTRKQLEALEEKPIQLEGYKKGLFPIMIGAGLIGNGTTAIYQSLLLLTFFKTEMNVAIPISLALGTLSDWNLYYAQIPAVKKLLAGQINSKVEHPHIASKLLANSIICSAAGLTPFNTPQGLKDTAQVFTTCITKMCNLPSSTWYESQISLPIIWTAGIILGCNAAYGLTAFRGPEVGGLVAKGFSSCSRRPVTVARPTSDTLSQEETSITINHGSSEPALTLFTASNPRIATGSGGSLGSAAQATNTDDPDEANTGLP